MGSLVPPVKAAIPRLLWITDRKRTKGRSLGVVCAAFLQGAASSDVECGVMLREKDLPGGEMLGLAHELRSITHEHNATFLVNSRIDVALAANADGAHMPQNDLPADVARELVTNRLLGISCHTLEEAQAAEDAGADYVTLGPVYDTASKRQFGSPLGTDALKAIIAELGIPVLGLGGISISNATPVMQAGAHGIACIGAIAAVDEPRNASSALAECASQAVSVG